MSAQIPDVEVEVFVGYGFDVEAYCWDCGYYFADFQAVEEGRFAGVVQAEDEDADFFGRPEEAREEGECAAHCDCVCVVVGVGIPGCVREVVSPYVASRSALDPGTGRVDA